MRQGLIDHFSKLEDPRCLGKIEHRLIDILVISVCAMIAGAESFEDIALYGELKEEWLRSFLELPHGIPSHDTFRRTFMLIKPSAFEACFEGWARSFGDRLDREVVAIDGKTLCGSFDTRRDQRPFHIVSAFATSSGLSLGQRQVDSKSNEITAIPDLLESLELKGTIVTLDAMGCQKSICTKIIDQGADYLITLKANQKKMFEAIQASCAQQCFDVGAPLKPVYDASDKGHGRLVRRRVFACPQAAQLENVKDWPGIHNVLAIETIRSIKGSGEVKAEIRYFITSCKDNPEDLASVIRQHWGIENKLHWVLDVIFREDQSRIRNQVAAQNVALLRKMAINLVRRHPKTKISLKGRKKMAAWDDTYMLKVITSIFHA